MHISLPRLYCSRGIDGLTPVNAVLSMPLPDVVESRNLLISCKTRLIEVRLAAIADLQVKH